MASKKSQSFINNPPNIFYTITLLLIGGVSGFYIGIYDRNNSEPNNGQLSQISEHTSKIYSNSEYGFSLQYPEGSKIELSTNPDYIIKISPPAEYFLAETQVIIQAVEEPHGDSINKFIEQDVEAADKNLYTGVLSAKIDGLPAKRFYSITCPELGSNCVKTNKYYTNAHRHTYIITATMHTDTDNNPINENITEEIISSIKFF